MPHARYSIFLEFPRDIWTLQFFAIEVKFASAFWFAVFPNQLVIPFHFIFYSLGPIDVEGFAIELLCVIKFAESEHIHIIIASVIGLGTCNHAQF